MGFKRTSEGRVFFQGAGDSANDGQDQHQQHEHEEQAPRPLQQGSPQTQIQILALLKALNERLKITQAERNRMRMELDAYRSMIEDLEGKVEKSDRAFEIIEEKLSRKDNGVEDRAEAAEKIARETLQELSETRKLLLEIEGKADRADKNLASLINVQKDHAQKMTGAATGYKMLSERLAQAEEKQNDVTGKVEQALSEQARLVRKVDKAIEDRTRFMRKIERIEETVIQMRDTLNARAMVLLTDQNPNIQTVNEDPTIIGEQPQQRPALQQSAAAQTAPAPFWRRKFEINAAGVIPLALILVAAGVLVTVGRQNDHGTGVSIERTVVDHLGLDESARAPAPDAAPTAQEQEAAMFAEQEAGAPAADPEWTVNEDTEAFAESLPAEDITEDAVPADMTAPDMGGAVDDIGAVNLQNNEEVLALLESNPDALAAQLNALEPGSTQPTEQIEIAEQQAAPAAPAAAKPAPVARVPAPPIGAPTKPAKPLTSAKPDSQLPEAIRAIEKQAFENVPEAQHDLAAIYTAGHGGAPQSYEKAAFWFRQAADNGVANARYNLGVLYHQGLGVKQDTQEAIRWYKSAADLKHPEAQYNLGIAYIEGIGVPYDPVLASEYFESAAQSGVMESAYNLGLIYENGLLGQAKPDVALMWYKNAADRGSPEAKAALEQLAKTLNISLDDVNKLVEEVQGAQGGAPAQPAAPAPAPEKLSSAPAPQSAPAPPVAEAPQAVVPVTPVVNQPLTARATDNTAVTAQIQEYLMRMGLYPGPADGMQGPLTQDAIRSYQAVNNIDVNGIPSAALLEHMLASNGQQNAEDPAQAFGNLN